MRHAIIFSGTSYNFRNSIGSLMENLVIPNDADVFILTSRYNMQRRTDSGKLPTATELVEWHNKSVTLERFETQLNTSDIDLIRNTFGDRLKRLEFIEDIPNYLPYIESQRVLMKDYINKFRSESTPAPFGGDVTSTDNGNLKCVVDQYNHVKKCFEMMEAYGKYDYVMRARLDFICPFEFKMSHYYLGRDTPSLFLCGSYKDDPFEWADEFCFFAKRSIADPLFKSLGRMGFLEKNGLTTVFDNNEFLFAPETQFAILLNELKLPVVNVKIYRSAKWSNDGRFDYMNYMFRRNILSIHHEYDLACKDQSDIYEHLPILFEYALRCEHITELGTRYGNSTVALMLARKKLITYDVCPNDKLDYLKMLGEESLSDFTIKLENPQEIEETDLLFIDTDHHVDQCSKELRLHESKVRKYLIFHDVVSFWEKGQGYEKGGGLRYAIEPFMTEHPEWKQVYRSEKNNGLLILERC